MSIFDLLFVGLFMASAITLLTATVLALRRQGSRARRTLRNLAICFAIYMSVVFLTALAAPQRVYPVGEDRCFDDWCIAVETADRSPAPEGILYTVTLRVSSRARRVSQREKGVNVYLTDDRGRRFDPAPDPAAARLSTFYSNRARRCERSARSSSRATGITLVWSWRTKARSASRAASLLATMGIHCISARLSVCLKGSFQ